MSAFAWVAAYSVAVLLFSLAGGSVPLLKRVSHGRLQLYLSLSAGVMLGAACFHVLPDAVTALPESFGWWVAGGVVGLFVIERFIAPHSHEPDGPSKAAGETDHAQHDHGHEHHHDHGHEHHHHHDHAHEPHALAAPPVAGWAAVLGLTLHTFMNGVAMAGAIEIDVAKPGTWWLPGLAVFLAIVLHKPADALAISTVLRRRGVTAGAIGLVQLGFALMVPVGALTFLITHNEFSEGLAQQITGAALAFSAGTFLFIALSDLLPEIHFHRHDRVPLFLALLAGVVLMGLIALLEPHEEPKGSQETPPTHAGDKPGWSAVRNEGPAGARALSKLKRRVPS